MAKFKNPFLNLIGVLTNMVLITVGAMYFHDCPAQNLLPIYLIVSGILNLLLPPGASRKDELKGDLGRLFFSLLKIPWTIAGYVWLSINQPINHQEPEDENYCYQPVYLTALWLNRIAIFFIVFYTILFVMFLSYKPWKIVVNGRSKTNHPPLPTKIHFWFN